MMDEVFKALLQRPADSHKYHFGHVLVIGGSKGMTGAPQLAAWAAIRSGAGLVSLASKSEVVAQMSNLPLEIMTHAIDNIDKLQAFIKERKISVVVIGPGMEQTTTSEEIIKSILTIKTLQVVLDGGALGIIAQQLDLLHSAACQHVVLTPHTGEFARLVLNDLASTRVGQQEQASKFAVNYACSLVLKGQQTFIAHPDGASYTNNTGGPGLATAGSGDVLSGIIGGFLAQQASSDSIEAAVYMHGLAGDLATTQKTEPGVIASDIIQMIPETFLKIKDRVTPS